MTLRLDIQMQKTVDLLAKNPLQYEYRNPIEAIERALWSGLVVASEPHKEFIQGRWRHVKTISVSGEHA